MSSKNGAISLSKGALFVIAGIILSLFPGLISGLFYIVGALIIGFSVLSIISNPVGKSSGIVGIIIGALVIILPKVINSGIPLVIGLITLWQTWKYIQTVLYLKKAGKDFRFPLITGIILAIISVIILTHLGGSGTLIRILLGAVLVGVGVLNIMIDKQHEDVIPDIIDIEAKNIE